jgi:uncharacterized protein YeaO (DUF488 family)
MTKEKEIVYVYPGKIFSFQNLHHWTRNLPSGIKTIVMKPVKIKRIYEPIESNDGCRVLIDCFWPGGVKKETVNINVWMKDLSPSAELRKWFDHDPEKWEAFRKGYKAELKNSETIDELIRYIKKYKAVTFLYAAKDE